jgi:hypothetical protein
VTLFIRRNPKSPGVILLLSTDRLSEHYASPLPDLGVWRGVGDILAGIAHIGLGGALLATTPEEMVTVPPVAALSLSSAIGEFAAGWVQLGIGVGELAGGTPVSSGQWELVSQFASPLSAQALAVVALSGGEETMEGVSQLISRVELAEALSTLNSLGKPGETLEKVDAALKTMEAMFNEALKGSPLFKSEEGPGTSEDSRSKGDAIDHSTEGDQGNRDFDTGPAVA